MTRIPLFLLTSFGAITLALAATSPAPATPEDQQLPLVRVWVMAA